MQLCYSICHQLNLPPAEFSSFPLVEGVQLLTREGAARIVVLVRFHEHEMPHTCHQLNLSPVEFSTLLVHAIRFTGCTRCLSVRVQFHRKRPSNSLKIDSWHASRGVASPRHHAWRRRRGTRSGAVLIKSDHN